MMNEFIFNQIHEVALLSYQRDPQERIEWIKSNFVLALNLVFDFDDGFTSRENSEIEDIIIDVWENLTYYRQQVELAIVCDMNRREYCRTVADIFEIEFKLFIRENLHK